MRVATVIPAEIAKMFQDDLANSGKTKYALAREIITDHYSTAKADGAPALTGDFEMDARALDQSGITTATLKRAMHELDASRKDKNTIKKTGAFHEQNAVFDIESMFMHGAKPTFHELKYHLDWWYQCGVIAAALARRGVRLPRLALQVTSAINAPRPTLKRDKYESTFVSGMKKRARKKGAIV